MRKRGLSYHVASAEGFLLSHCEVCCGIGCSQAGLCLWVFWLGHKSLHSFSLLPLRVFQVTENHS